MLQKVLIFFKPETIIWEKKHFRVLSLKLKIPPETCKEKSDKTFHSFINISCHEITFSFFFLLLLYAAVILPLTTLTSDFSLLIFGLQHLTISPLADEWRWFLHDFISFDKSLIISFATPFVLNNLDMLIKGVLIRQTPAIADA